jgi:putative peptide zinc metalloprotease protein
MAQGVVWPGEQSQVRSGTDGTVESVAVPPGATVKSGDPLIRCANPDIDEEVAALEAKLREYQARHLLAMATDRTQERIMREEIAVIENELRLARERREALVVRSPVDGLFILPDAVDYPGRYIRRGEPLGYVADYGKLTVLSAIPQNDVGKIRNSVRSVTARPVGRIFHRIPARLMREVPAASADLPTAALSLEGGGPFALDPRARQEKKSFETLFYFEVALDERMEGRLGSRVFLRFEHEAETLAVQWYRVLRRVFMRIFNL